MSRLCFGSYANLLKNATSVSKKDVVEMLVNGIIDNVADSIDDSDKYKLFNSKLDIQYLKDEAGTIGVESSINKYFSDNIIPNLISLNINELLELFKGIINGDETIVNKDKSEFIAIAKKETLSLFLSKVFLFATLRPNNLKKNPLPTIMDRNTVITLSGGRIYLNGEEIELPDKLTPPNEFENEESIYITELLKAFAENAKQVSITYDKLLPNQKIEFNRHRQDYFNAEAVHRRMREIYSKEYNEFDLLKQDTFDGIIDTHSMSYSNGYDQLLKVLQQAVTLQNGKSLLWQLPKWIGASEKKGVCHILVNDKKIAWVIEDE